MKQFVKALDKDSATFKYLCKIFPQISDAKLREGIFVGPQIRQVMSDTEFDTIMTESEVTAWRSFKLLCTDFLGNHKASNFSDLVENLLTSYRVLGCHMSLKDHFLHALLDFFHPTSVMSATSMANGSIRKSLKWKNATKESGIRQ